MTEFMVPLKTPLIFWADATWHLNDGSVAGHVWHSNLGWGHLKAQIVMSLIVPSRSDRVYVNIAKQQVTSNYCSSCLEDFLDRAHSFQWNVLLVGEHYDYEMH